jgi:hypothetical protein
MFKVQSSRFELQSPPSSFKRTRKNGGADEVIGDFPFVLSLVEAFIGFFPQNFDSCLTLNFEH